MFNQGFSMRGEEPRDPRQARMPMSGAGPLGQPTLLTQRPGMPVMGGPTSAGMQLQPQSNPGLPIPMPWKMGI